MEAQVLAFHALNIEVHGCLIAYHVNEVAVRVAVISHGTRRKHAPVHLGYRFSVTVDISCNGLFLVGNRQLRQAFLKLLHE